MKLKKLMMAVLTGLAALPALASEPFNWTEYYFLLPTDEDSRPYKRYMDEKYGTQWNLNVAYNLWNTEGAMPGGNNHNNLLMASLQLQQRLIEDSVGGGTWFRLEVDSCWGLDRESAQSDTYYTSFFGIPHSVHNNAKGPHNVMVAEAMLMHFRNNKRTVFTAGIVDLSNYIDCVSIAASGYHGFNNTGFVGPFTNPVTLYNLGAIAMHQIDDRNYIIGGISRNTAGPGDNPFGGSISDGYLATAEYGHICNDGKTILRFSPFIHRSTGNASGKHASGGFSCSIEYKQSDALTLYSRAGYGFRDDVTEPFGIAIGAQAKLCPSRPQDYCGLSYGLFKGKRNSDGDYYEGRQHQVEALYSFQVNEYMKVVPHVQAIMNPTYYDADAEFIWGFMTVFVF